MPKSPLFISQGPLQVWSPWPLEHFSALEKGHFGTLFSALKPSPPDVHDVILWMAPWFFYLFSRLELWVKMFTSTVQLFLSLKPERSTGDIMERLLMMVSCRVLLQIVFLYTKIRNNIYLWIYRQSSVKTPLKNFK